MTKHPSDDVYAEDWPVISIKLDYQGGLRYWGVTVELGGMVIPGQMDAFTAALKDAEVACDELNNKMLGRARAAAAERHRVVIPPPRVR